MRVCYLKKVYLVAIIAHFSLLSVNFLETENAMNIKNILFNSHIDKLESEIILAHILHVDRAYLHTYPERDLKQQENDKFLSYVQERKQGKPIAYIIQKKEFWSLELKVTQDTLIPRPETELLVEVIVEKFNPGPTQSPSKTYRFLELATGSGAISIAITKNHPNFEITATDISQKALEVARENQKYHQIKNIHFIQSDWFEKIDAKDKFDAIICNPPYIAENDSHLTQGDLRFEPKIALTPGKTGLEAIEHIIKMAKNYLLPSGWLFLEHGYDQGEKVAKLFQESDYCQIMAKKDLKSLPRVTFGAASDVQS